VPCSVAGSLHSCNGDGALQRLIGLVRRRAGLPRMSDEIAVGASRCRVGLAPAASLRWPPVPGVSGGVQGLVQSAAGGDGRIPSLAGDDDGVQVA
jgi:hypothetical protein